jgi:hypothetical protein
LLNESELHGRQLKVLTFWEKEVRFPLCSCLYLFELFCR